MIAYFLRRLLLIPVTLFGIQLVMFTIMQFVPGGPVERVMMQMENQESGGSSRLSGSGGDSFGGANTSYRGAQGIDEAFRKELEKQFGFDRPIGERFLTTLWNNATFNFGNSYYKGVPVTELILRALPVSMSLGLWIMLISYAVSIPLGIRKAVKDGSSFDTWTSVLITIGYAIPNFLFGVLLLLLFASSSFLNIFPMKGIVPENFSDLSFFGKITGYFYHLALPLLSLVISSFAVLTTFTKNSFLDEIRKQYVLTARMKGLSENKILYGHIFRNAMLIVIAGFPAAFITAFFSGSLLIENLFSLEGIGYLSFTSIVDRDYPVVFATLYIFSLISLLVQLLTDIIYMLIDPRIDFDKRDA